MVVLECAVEVKVDSMVDVVEVVELCFLHAFIVY